MEKMARSRNIKPGFFINEAVVELPFEYRLLFIGLWTLADREGRLEDRPKKIKMAIFPADSVDVEEGIWCLHRAGLVLCYAVENERFIYIPSFIKHQSPHVKEAESTIPPPEFETSTGLAPDEHPLNPESGILNPESPLLNEEGGKPRETAPAPKLKKQPTRIPFNFPLTPEMWEWIITELPDLREPKDAHENFIEHWSNRTDARAFKLDWNLTWKKGMRLALKWQIERDQKIAEDLKNGQNNGHAPTNSGDRNAQRISNTKSFIAELRRQGAEEQNISRGGDGAGGENDQSFESAAVERGRHSGSGG